MKQTIKIKYPVKQQSRVIILIRPNFSLSSQFFKTSSFLPYTFLCYPNNFILLVQSNRNHSEGPQRQIIRTISNQKHQTKDPNSIYSPPCKFIVLQISIRLLIQHEMKVHQSHCIDIVEKLKFRKKDQEPMQKSYGISPPRNAIVEDKWRYDE